MTGSRRGWTTVGGARRAHRLAAAALGLALGACGNGAPAPEPPAAPPKAAVTAELRCQGDALRPVSAAPAEGLWVQDAGAAGARVAASIGPAQTEAGRPALIHRVEALEATTSGATIRSGPTAAAVRLELIPPRPAAAGARMSGSPRLPSPPSDSGSEPAEPAAIYAVAPLVLLAAYEPCTAGPGEPRLRYLRRDRRGRVVTDVMLRRESAASSPFPSVPVPQPDRR